MTNARPTDLRSAAVVAPDAIAWIDGSTRLTTRELLALVDRADPAAELLADGRFVARRLDTDLASVCAVARALGEGPALIGLHPRYSDEVVHRNLAVFRDPDACGRFASLGDVDAAMVVFTSGTSGAAAPVVLGRAAFDRSAIASANRLAFGAGDRYLLSMPLAHVGGASIVARAIASRAAIVRAPSSGRFEPTEFLDAIVRAEVTHASVVPTMLRRLVDAALPCPTSLRRLVVGGAACEDSLARAACALGYPVVRTYGMTETAAMSTCESRPGEGGSGSPLDGAEIRIVDGEIRIRTAARATVVFPDLQLRVDDEGFLRTNDAGTFAEGLLHVQGRRDDVIVTGGENVHPAEVEAALLAIPGISAAVVFGVADAEWGRAVVAAITGESSLDDVAIDDAMRRLVASFARPKRYARFDAFPTLPSGKVDRRAVVASVLAG